MTYKVKRVTFIGDVHGLTTWKPVVERALAEHNDVVFLGDYVDSYFLKPVDIMPNLLEIIEYKKKYPNRITLLFGNHDWAYYMSKTGITGFVAGAWENYRSIFKDNIDLFDVAWGHFSDHQTTRDGKPMYTLATHAGLTQEFYEFLVKKIKDPKSPAFRMLDGTDWEKLPLHELLNKFKDSDYLWKVGTARGGWGCPGPLWADKSEVETDAYEGINQVVGHTPLFSITVVEHGENLLHFVDQYGNTQLFWLSLDL